MISPTALTRWKKVENERQKMITALVSIAEMGAVCEGFEICQHSYCRDSAGACLAAINLLTELGLRGLVRDWCACPANLCADDTSKVRCRGH